MAGLTPFFKRSIIFASTMILLAVSGCGLFGGKKFSVTFNELKGLKANDKVYVYPANLVVGTVDSLGVYQGQAEVFIELDRKFPDAVTMDSYFFIDIDPVQKTDKCILVSVPQHTEKEIVTRNKRLAGIDSRLQWTMVQAGKKIGPAISELLNGYAEKLNDWYDKQLQSLSEEDWERLGDDIKKEMTQLFDQAREQVDSDYAEHKEHMRQKIDKLRKKLDDLSNSEEVEQLKQSLEAMLDRLERDLDTKTSVPEKQGMKI